MKRNIGNINEEFKGKKAINDIFEFFYFILLSHKVKFNASEVHSLFHQNATYPSLQACKIMALL